MKSEKEKEDDEEIQFCWFVQREEEEKNRYLTQKFQRNYNNLSIIKILQSIKLKSKERGG